MSRRKLRKPRRVCWHSTKLSSSSLLSNMIHCQDSPPSSGSDLESVFACIQLLLGKMLAWILSDWNFRPCCGTRHGCEWVSTADGLFRFNHYWGCFIKFVTLRLCLGFQQISTLNHIVFDNTFYWRPCCCCHPLKRPIQFEMFKWVAPCFHGFTILW